MSQRRLLRRLAAVFAVFAMLFSQLALAAYACPLERMAVIAVVADAECCTESASASANLCHEHCKDSASALPDAQPPVPDFVPGFSVPLPPAQDDAPHCEYSQVALFHSISPPLSILNCCFRI